MIEAAESAGRTIAGILDLPDYYNKECLGYKIIGNDRDIKKYAEDNEFIITLGFIDSALNRIKINDLIEESGGKLATVIAKTANVSKYARVGEGTVILHNACVNAGAVIGRNCIINTASNIEHDSHIGDFCHISTGVMVNGGCEIGGSTFIGSGGIIVQGVKICENVIVGAGGVVIKDIIEEGTYAGVPAKRI